MASSAALIRLQSACVTCVRGGQRFVGRYHDFLLAPGTIFTSLSLLLLILATIQTTDGLINSAHAHTWLYLSAALVGSVYIWWSAIQGIRKRDFTADIPVSFATAAALIIGQYSAAAVVAVLLLLGILAHEGGTYCCTSSLREKPAFAPNSDRTVRQATSPKRLSFAPLLPSCLSVCKQHATLAAA